MNPSSAFTYLLPLFFLVFIFVSCDTDENPVGTLEEAVERIPDVQLIEGADNATLNVNYDRERSLFKISIRNINSHSIISNGVFNAWCVELNKPLSRGQDLTGAKLFATNKDPVFNKLAYIINNRGALERQNPGLSWKDIQVTFWVILESPTMKLEAIENEIPSSLEGYNRTTVNNILADVQTNGSSFNPGIGHTQLFLADAGDDEQLTVVEVNTAWARMNGGPLGPDDDFTYAFNPDNGDESSVGGGNWATYIKFTDGGDHSDFPLYAGQTNFVGWLNVSRDSGELVIVYNLNEDYVLSVTHVHVGLVFPDDFPTSSNTWDNPQIGQFDHGNSYEEDPFNTWPDDDEVRIPWVWDDNDELIIAAHAVVWEIEGD